jgi:hypothetical protein
MGAQGLAEVDFGAHPGAVEKEMDVATAGVISSSLVEAWLVPDATTDHTVDEHVAMGDSLHVQGRYLSDGNIRIRVAPRQQQFMDERPSGEQAQTQTRGVKSGPQTVKTYGKWSVGWVWN